MANLETVCLQLLFKEKQWSCLLLGFQESDIFVSRRIDNDSSITCGRSGPSLVTCAAGQCVSLCMTGMREDKVISGVMSSWPRVSCFIKSNREDGGRKFGRTAELTADGRQGWESFFTGSWSSQPVKSQLTQESTGSLAAHLRAKALVCFVLRLQVKDIHATKQTLVCQPPTPVTWPCEEQYEL